MKTSTTYHKVASYEAKKGEFNTCILLYSGGLDTSVMLKWIQNEYNADVIALTIDIGQLHEDLAEVKQKALDLGAKEALVIDAKDRFADELLAKAIKANADYQGGYRLATCLGRVIKSQIAVEKAHEQNATVIAHGCTGKGNDQVRFDSYITTLDPSLKIIAPVREWSMSRETEIAYAEKHGIPLNSKIKPIYSYDDNMWGSSADDGDINDTNCIAKLDDILQVCTDPLNAPDESEVIEVGFEAGTPVSFNGKKGNMKEIIKNANSVGAKHGVGICQLIEDRLIGLKIRNIYEAPAAEILVQAHYNLEKLVSTLDLNKMKEGIDSQWGYFCYSAKWFDPAMNSIHAFQDAANKLVTGTVKLKLYKGAIQVVAVSSPYSMIEATHTINQNASAGFIELYNLAQKTSYNIHHE